MQMIGVSDTQVFGRKEFQLFHKYFSTDIRCTFFSKNYSCRIHVVDLLVPSSLPSKDLKLHFRDTKQKRGLKIGHSKKS